MRSQRMYKWEETTTGTLARQVICASIELNACQEPEQKNDG